MVIAKCLRSPQQSSDGCACRNNPYPAFHLVTGVELKFDNLRGFLRRRHKLPLFNGVLASLNKQRVSTHDPGGFHMSVRGDDDFEFDLPPGFVGRTTLSKPRGA